MRAASGCGAGHVQRFNHSKSFESKKILDSYCRPFLDECAFIGKCYQAPCGVDLQTPGAHHCVMAAVEHKLLHTGLNLSPTNATHTDRNQTVTLNISDSRTDYPGYQVEIKSQSIQTTLHRKTYTHQSRIYSEVLKTKRSSGLLWKGTPSSSSLTKTSENSLKKTSLSLA